MSGTVSFGPGMLRNVQEPERSIGIAPRANAPAICWVAARRLEAPLSA
jgi:hypothetical protein